MAHSGSQLNLDDGRLSTRCKHAAFHRTDRWGSLGEKTGKHLSCLCIEKLPFHTIIPASRTFQPIPNFSRTASEGLKSPERLTGPERLRRIMNLPLYREQVKVLNISYWQYISSKRPPLPSLERMQTGERPKHGLSSGSAAQAPLTSPGFIDACGCYETT